MRKAKQKTSADPDPDAPVFRRYEYSDCGNQHSVILMFNKKAQENVRLHSAFNDNNRVVSGQALINRLVDAGAVIQDIIDENGRRIAACQITGWGKRSVHYLQDGKVNDPAPGIPAYQLMDLKTGLVRTACSYTRGESALKYYSSDELAALNERLRSWNFDPARLGGTAIPGAKLPQPE